MTSLCKSKKGRFFRVQVKPNPYPKHPSRLHYKGGSETAEIQTPEPNSLEAEQPQLGFRVYIGLIGFIGL